MSFICIRMKNDFHINGWAPTLVLKQRPGGTRKWPISYLLSLHPGKGWILPYNLHLLENFPVSQVAGYKCTLLAGNSISPAGSEEQINVSQQSPKMLKMALEIFIHALLLLLGLFLKSFRWVPLNIDFPWTPSLKNTLKLPESLERATS